MNFDIYDELTKKNYGMTLKELDENTVKGIKANILKLRNSYKSNTPRTNYFNEEIRKAYMLSYYPNYSEPIYELMDKYIKKELEEKLNKKLKFTFFGAGPGAEVLGVSKYLCDINYEKQVEFILTDYEDGWNNQRNITKNLIQSLGSIKSNGLTYISGCDLTINCQKDCFEWKFCKSILYKSDVFIMQNCLNHIATSNTFYKNLLRRIDFMKEGSIFIIIDFGYEISMNIIKKLATEKKFEIISTNIFNKLIESRINDFINEDIDKKIFSGEGLIRKKVTKYYYIIIKKVEK